MISPVQMAIAVMSYLGKHSHMFGHPDEVVQKHRVGNRHETRAHEKVRRRIRKASQRRNRG